ncbi:MAG: alpha-hydroxy-acid oxidizing protein [Thermoleophilaceae bacterium]|nr:alpha-hydroxy-acid oxidizing protein [Thermoleophilaceae bacterium]
MGVDPGGAEPASRAADGSAARKAEHLRIAARLDVLHETPAGLDAIRLRHRALPERDLDEVDIRTSFLGRELAAPLLISAMTGGARQSFDVNGRLMAAAASVGAAWSWGSGRALLRDRDRLTTYVPDPQAPRPPLSIANLGATHVRGRDGPAQAEQLVELLEADALFLHLNPLQEAIQPEGDTRFSGVLDAIGRVVGRIAPVPVGVKEVGFRTSEGRSSV